MGGHEGRRHARDRHTTPSWKRCALATDVEWVTKAFHMFAWMAPGEVQTFSLDQLDEAKEWTAG